MNPKYIKKYKKRDKNNLKQRKNRRKTFKFYQNSENIKIIDLIKPNQKKFQFSSEKVKNKTFKNLKNLMKTIKPRRTMSGNSKK